MTCVQLRLGKTICKTTFAHAIQLSFDAAYYQYFKSTAINKEYRILVADDDYDDAIMFTEGYLR
jgi:hypothetical protein